MAEETIRFRLDGEEVTARPGESILQAARRHGVEIPHLCWRDGLRPDGNCRACMVEIAGERTLAPACARQPAAGMEITSAEGRARRAQALVLELLRSDLPAAARERGEVATWAERLGVKESRFPARERRAPDDTQPGIRVDLDACIECTRCLRACREVQNNDVIGYAFRGGESRIVFDLGDPMGRSSCVGCGECVQVCPTGALLPSEPGALEAADRAVASLCPYCGVGCQLTYHVRGDRIVRVDGRDGPANRGRLCVKGRFGYDYVRHPQRLTEPLIRRGDVPKSVDMAAFDPGDPYRYFRAAGWEEALDFAAGGLRRLRDAHGGRALAGFGSAKGSNEEAYLFQKLVRTGFGSNNVDHCTRLCHASSVAALLEMIGSGAVSNPVADVAAAEVMVVIGANPPVNHPVGEDDHRRRADEAAILVQGAEVQRQVAQARRQDAAGGAPRQVGVEGVARQHAAAVLVDQLPHGDARRGQVDAGPAHPSAHGEAAQPLAAAPAVAGEPAGAPFQDLPHPVERLQVVDQGGAAEEADLGDIGGAQPGHPAPALEGLDQGRLLAADVGPGAPAQVDLRQGGGGVGPQRGQLPFQQLPAAGVFVPQVEVDGVHVHHVGGDQRPLQEAVGVALQVVAVLEGAGLPLVDVHHHPPRRRLPAHDAPLAAHRETGAAEAPQAGVLQLREDPFGLPLPAQALFQQGVAPVRAVGVVTDRAGGDLRLRAPRRHGLTHAFSRGPGQGVPANHRHRGVGAAPDAGDPLHPHARAEGAGQCRRQLLRPGQGAADGVADADGAGRRRFPLAHHVEVVIEGGGLVDLGGTQLHLRRQGAQVGGGENAEMVLDAVQVLDQEIPPRRRIAEQGADLFQCGGVDRFRAAAASSAAAVSGGGSGHAVKPVAGCIVEGAGRVAENPARSAGAGYASGTCAGSAEMRPVPLAVKTRTSASVSCRDGRDVPGRRCWTAGGRSPPAPCRSFRRRIPALTRIFRQNARKAMNDPGSRRLAGKRAGTAL